MSNRDVIRIGIVGAGFIGAIHAAGYAHNPRARLTAVADIRPEKAGELAAKYGLKAYPTLDAMLTAEKLDAVDICLPSPYHREAVVKAAAAGLHILVEKPFALNLEDIDAMIAAVEAGGVRLMVAHVCRFMPEYMVAKSLLEEGKLGRPLFFGAWRVSATPGWSWNNWLLDRQQSGGTIMDLQIHDIDLSNWLLGEPQSFYMQEIMTPGRLGPAHVVSNLTYANGAAACLEASHLMPPSYPFTTGYRLVGEEGVVEFMSPRAGEKQVLVYRGDEVTTIDGNRLPAIMAGDPYTEELAHFVDCLLTGAPFRVSPMEARLAVATVLKLVASFSRGTWGANRRPG
ncbi:Gfo/Idh/MocA family protein [Neomoorella humiferrea]|uniref:Glucose--fructose oxidoreductase n=1 Tax=Neomoorella humiferrea TaxID=676965 RepID=A0A2T0AVW1_9FIRM|nr:Gfo/Idh/MocA family oxidoreductase [Moorella humiferrea]PRR74870.1 Glucose--fructose oxidoreductase precursor [Moorella humiferrea]